MVGSETCGGCLLISPRRLRVCSFHEGNFGGKCKTKMDYYTSLAVLHLGWGAVKMTMIRVYCFPVQNFCPALGHLHLR